MAENTQFEQELLQEIRQIKDLLTILVGIEGSLISFTNVVRLHSVATNYASYRLSLITNRNRNWSHKGSSPLEAT